MRYKNLVGRDAEIGLLERIFKSNKSEFLAIYGRRRVGKSYLVSEVYRDKLLFTAVGTYVKDGDKNQESYRQLQLTHFHDALILSGLKQDTPCPKSWREAFLLLRKLLSASKKHRKVILLDELPWLAGPQSTELIAELGYFWNSWADRERNIILVVCGSATSWMLDNVIHDYGGLHGRLTEIIHLKQFSLSECETYYKRRGFHLSRYEMALCYMVIGGIPYYLDKLRNDKSITENIDAMFFADEMIHQEFKNVFAGLYASKDKYIDIVKAVGRHLYGMTQAEILSATGLTGGGTFSKMLENLKDSGIIREYPRYGKERVEKVYQLVDFFSLFYLRFIDGKQCRPGGWNSINRTGAFYNWAGDTFEVLCCMHLREMQNALHIPGIDKSYCFFGQDAEGKRAQIDLVLECNASRTDFLCEMKFSESKYPLTQKIKEDLLRRIDALRGNKIHKASHSIQVVMVTSMGLGGSDNSGIISRTLSLDDLFSKYG